MDTQPTKPIKPKTIQTKYQPRLIENEELTFEPCKLNTGLTNKIEFLQEGMIIWTIWHADLVPLLREYLNQIDPTNGPCPELLSHQTITMAMDGILNFIEGVKRTYPNMIEKLNDKIQIVIQKPHQMVLIAAGSAF